MSACANEAFCGSLAREGPKPDGYWQLYPLCQRCRIMGWGALVIVPGKTCAACAGTDKVALRFPAKGCTDWVCVDCARYAALWRDCDADVNPEKFGAPACPNGCSNPVVGEQCGCAEWEEALCAWAVADPDAATRLEEAQCAAIAAHPPPPKGPRACPVCARRVRGD